MKDALITFVVRTGIACIIVWFLGVAAGDGNAKRVIPLIFAIIFWGVIRFTYTVVKTTFFIRNKGEPK